MVEVIVTLNATGYTTGNIDLEVRKDIALTPDETEKGCFKRVDLVPGRNEIGDCFFEASELTTGDFRHYYLRLSWNSELIYEPFDSDTRELVMTEA